MLIPLPCAVCGTVDGALTDQLCRACLGDLPAHPPGVCQGCGTVLGDAAVCSRCFVPTPAFDGCIAGCMYAYPVNQVIKKLKYQARLDLVRPLCLPLIKRIGYEGVALPDCLVPTPLHGSRLRARGFNQAGEIAGVLAQNLSLPVDGRLVRRQKNTLQQYNLSPEQRSTNVRGAFTLLKSIGYERVAIVDDVLTSGATANELALLLKRNGVAHVQVWCAAQAAPAG